MGMTREGRSSSGRGRGFCTKLFSKRIWKQFLGFLVATILFLQFRFSRDYFTSYHSALFVVQDEAAIDPAVVANGSATSIAATKIEHFSEPIKPTPPRENIRRTPHPTFAPLPKLTGKPTALPEPLPLPSALPSTLPLSVSSPPPSLRDPHGPSNITTALLDFGELWITGVKRSLKVEERNRVKGHRPKSQERKVINANFKRLKSRLDQINATEIDDPRFWHAVTPGDYLETLREARSSLDEMMEKIYTDCVLWLVPQDNLTAAEVEANDRNRNIKYKNGNAGPLLKFQCGESESGVLQDTPCRSANLCLVRSDPLQWRTYYNGSSKTNGSIDDSNKNATASHYNHTDLEHRFATSTKDEKSTTGLLSKSAILTMVNSLSYLRNPRIKNRGDIYFIWESFLNKASYALRTNRDLYIWIGEFENDRDINSTTVLNQRNTETLLRTFGTDCKPETADRNVVHYYKPVALAALFRKLRRSQQEQHGEENHKVWFVDADIYFNEEAFSLRSGDDTPMSLDDYFDICPQASLLGSQNPSGKDANILMNGGLLGLQSPSDIATSGDDPLDDWVLNIASLWWYCRCGERDQIALWLLLFATWSAESGGNGTEKFAYPRVAFENYLFSWFAIMPHFRTFVPGLQASWIEQTKTNTKAITAVPDRKMVTPTNASLFDGGNNFLDSTRGKKYSYPLELPHVLLLPLEPFSLPPDYSSVATANITRTDFYLSMVRKDQNNKPSLLSHTKNKNDVCYGFVCWPFLIREDPRNLPPVESNEIANHSNSSDGALSSENDDDDDEEEGDDDDNDDGDDGDNDEEDDNEAGSGDGLEAKEGDSNVQSSDRQLSKQNPETTNGKFVIGTVQSSDLPVSKADPETIVQKNIVNSVQSSDRPISKTDPGTIIQNSIVHTVQSSDRPFSKIGS